MKNLKKYNKIAKRITGLFKDGEPRYMRIYDNEGNTLDRYTVVFTGNYAGKAKNTYDYVSASETGGGVYMHEQTTGRPVDKPSYRHLGKKCSFRSLSIQLQRLVLNDYLDFWRLQDVDGVGMANVLFDNTGSIAWLKFREASLTGYDIVISVHGAIYQRSAQTGINHPIEQPQNFCSAIDDAFELRKLLKIEFGDIDTGEMFGASNDKLGYIKANVNERGSNIMAEIEPQNKAEKQCFLLGEFVVKITDAITKETLFIHPSINAKP